MCSLVTGVQTCALPISDSTFDNAFCRDFDAQYRASFSADSLMVNELYVSVLYRSVVDPALAAFARLERGDPASKARWQAKANKEQHGRASGRERGGQQVGNSVVSRQLKKKKNIT